MSREKLGGKHRATKAESRFSGFNFSRSRGDHFRPQSEASRGKKLAFAALVGLFVSGSAAYVTSENRTPETYSVVTSDTTEVPVLVPNTLTVDADDIQLVDSEDNTWVDPSGGSVQTSGFGPRWGTQHQGVDFGVNDNEPIYAADDGVVENVQCQEYDSAVAGYGCYITLDHGGGIQTGYAHMEEGDIFVAPGQQVNAGDQIALAGSHGDSTAPHLHFEVMEGGTRVNPAGYLDGSHVQTGPAPIETETEPAPMPEPQNIPTPDLDVLASAPVIAADPEVLDPNTYSNDNVVESLPPEVQTVIEEATPVVPTMPVEPALPELPAAPALDPFQQAMADIDRQAREAQAFIDSEAARIQNDFNTMLTNFGR